MTEGYIELINKVNRTVDRITKGKVIAAKAEEVKEANRSNQTQLADRASRVGQVDSVAFAHTVKKINTSPSTAFRFVPQGLGTSQNTVSLGDGVYLVIYISDQYDTIQSGIIAIKSNAISSSRFSFMQDTQNGGTINYNSYYDKKAAFLTFAYAGANSYDMNLAPAVSGAYGYAYFMKIGTLEEE